MKKGLFVILFSFFSFIIFSSGVSAKTGIDYDLRNHDDEFMIFYELKESTPFANFLLSHGSGRGFVDYLLGTYSTDSLTNKINSWGTGSIFNYKQYSVWVRYADDSTYSNAAYAIDVELSGFSSFSVKITYLFDSDINYIFYKVVKIDSINHTLDFSSHPTYYFNYFTGNVEFYDSKNTYYLHKLIDLNGNEYIIQEDFFQSVGSFFKSIFVGQSFYSDSYVRFLMNNSVIGKNIPLFSIAKNLFNQVDDFGIDYNIYDRIDISEYSNGLFIIPKTGVNTEDTSISFMAYTINDNYINGNLIRIEDDGSFTFLDNVFRSDFNNDSSILKFNYSSFYSSSDLPEHLNGDLFGNIGYYFYADNSNSSAVIIYNKTLFEVSYVNRQYDNATVYNHKTGESSLINHVSDLKSRSTDKLAETHYVYNGERDINGKYVVCDVNDNCVVTDSNHNGEIVTDVNTVDSSSISNIINTSRNGITAFSSIVKELFVGFPFLSSIFTFGISTIVIISIYKALRG